MSYEVIGWLIAIVVFIAAEAATVALVSVWFIGGAVCALAAAILGAGLAVQLAVFLAVSAVLLAFVCRSPRKKWTKKPERMNARPAGRSDRDCDRDHRRLRRYRCGPRQRRPLDGQMCDRRTHRKRPPRDHRACRGREALRKTGRNAL